MLSLLLILCFKIHTNYKRNTLQYTASEQYGCGNINQINSRNWKVITDPNQDYLVRCHDGSVSLGGEGLLWFRTNITNVFANGLFDIQNSDFTCNYNFFEASGALSNKVQLIHFRGTGIHTFSGTTFKDCGINPYHHIGANGRLPDNWDPSLIYITGDSQNSFYSVTFKHEKNSKIQPWELRPTRPIRLEEGALNVTFSHFYNSSCFTQGSFLHLGSLKTISISNCDFQECYCEGGLGQQKEAKGHAIYVTNQNACEVTIDSCDFLDCGRNYQGHVICCEAPALILSNNNFVFENANCSGCVRCIGKGKYHFINNYFDSARNDDKWKGVGIHYDGDLGSFQNNKEDIAFDLNRFNNIRGQNEGRCLSAQIRDGNFTALSKNIIENCPLGGFCVKIMQRTAIEKFELSDWEFRNNEVNSKFGGGSGIWIENEGYNNVYTYNFTLYVKGCKFENNVCYERGGAFQMGYADDVDKDKYVTRIEIEISGCNFTNNTASHGGGAIAISTNYPLTITGCQFIDNKSPENGGAIYIRTVVPDQSGNNQQMPYATITGCDFIGNSGKEAHCIYILDGPQTPIEVTNCKFYNNYDENYKAGACILSNSIELTVTESEFKNNDLEHSSGGVNVTSRSTLTISDVKFIRCSAGSIQGSYGGGIGYSTHVSNDQSRPEHIQITDCTFDGNGGLNGVAIGLKPNTYPEISDIKIQNHVLTNWIFFIFFQFETEGDYVLNKIVFTSNSYDSGTKSEFGGGTGIWIAESEDIDYLSAFNLVFDRCDFVNNYSPENGGAISYGGSPRLQSVELTFKNCTFRNNKCKHYYGGACRFETTKPVSIMSCNFDNNTAEMNSVTGGSGGGAIFFGETVRSFLIDDCNFSNCFAYRGSFIFTNGAMKNISISKSFFSTLQEGQDNSVYIEVDSQVTQFYFDSNTFKGLHCQGQDGGAGLHINNGAECELTNCKFISCVGSENSGMIKIPDSTNYDSQLIFTLCEFNNEEQSTAQSARAIYIDGNSLVRFNSCRFLSFEQLDRIGAVLYSKSTTSTVFFNCSFLGLKGVSLMQMPEARFVEVLGCQFSSCQVSAESSIIVAEKAQNFTVSDCIFFADNNVIRFGPLVETGLISYNSFEQCTSNSKSGAVYVDGSNVECDILGNNFTRCTSISEGTAIRINAGKLVSIHNCKFTNNYKDDGDNCFTISSGASELNFYDSIIEYLDDDAIFLGSGLKITALSTSVINNVQFIKIHRPSAIEYAVESSANSEHSTTVTECLFREVEMKGSAISNNQYSCFNFGNNLNVEFVNNTIRSHLRPEQDWDNLLIGKIESKIENCIFDQNKVNGRIAGGTGVEFSGSNVQIINCQYYSNRIYILERNKAISTSGVGGAVQIGYNGLTISVEIDNCTFDNNAADYEGGALAIQCNSAYIHDSVFTNNAAGREVFESENANFKMGGAIYFNSGSANAEYKLAQCVFKENSADSNGHALFCAGSSTKVTISDQCMFEDNSLNGGSQIFLDDGGNLDFSNSTVQLKNLKTKSRGIEVSDGNLIAHHTTFSKVQAASKDGLVEGNAILVNDGDNVAEISDNTFLDCYIDNQRSYIVTFNGSALNFENNIFDFSQNKGCGCLRIYCYGNINVLSNTFRNANTPSNFHGVFIYEETVRRPTANGQRVAIRFNTFEKCNSDQTACFQFRWISQDYDFLDNTFQNNNLKNYLGEFDFMGKKIYGKFECGGNRFINNTARSLYGGGSGLWFQNKPGPYEYLLENHYTITLEDCEFIGNHAVHDETKSDYHNGQGGAIQIGYTESVSNVDVVFRNTTFKNNFADREGGAISLEIIGYALIDNCTFEGNRAGAGNDAQYNVAGAVYIYPDFNHAAGHYDKENGDEWVYQENVTILNSKFVSNRAQDATAVYIHSAKHTNFIVSGTNFKDNVNIPRKNFTIVSEAVEFIFMQSRIEFTSINQAVAGIRTSSIIAISASQFINNCISDQSTAESIYAEEASEEIDVFGSTFQDCGKDMNGYATIKLHAQTAFIERNVFNFTTHDAAGHAMIIKKYSDVNFVENFVSGTRCRGAFNYDPDTSYLTSLENVRIERCTFDDCHGANARAIYCRLSTQNIKFSNNTIQNCSPYGVSAEAAGYLFVFILEPSTPEFVVDSIIFKNLTTDSDFGGGCGAWIQSSRKFTLIFRDCTFINNTAIHNKVIRECNNGKGGALQYGWTPSISDIDLVITNCLFERNTAEEEGGALCLMTQNDVEISNCRFVNNKAGSKQSEEEYYGGAIAIFPNYDYGIHHYSESIRIEGCTFSGNLGDNANAIFIQDASNSDIFIDGNCKFIDNTDRLSNKVTIMIEARKLEVSESVFDFTSVTKSCNAIRTNATTFLLHDNKFTRCCLASGLGSALIINDATKECTIRDNQFVDNGGNNRFGSVIYTSASSFEYQGNSIDYTDMRTSDRGIFVEYQCRFYITDSHFHHCRILRDQTGAALHYRGARKTSYTEDILFDNVTFDNNSCNYASCFYMNPVTIPVLRNVNVRNHQEIGNFVTVIIFQSNTRQDVTLEKWTFDNNLYNRSSDEDLKQDCGGIGLWIAPSKTSPGFRDSYKFIFDTCSFRNNRNNLCGGAFTYGYSNTLRYIYVCMNDCTFENNVCDGERGGALCFNGQVPVTIERSVFRGNKCSSGSYKGHCIYIDRRCKAVITDCSFTDNGIFNRTLVCQRCNGQSIIQCSGAQLDFIRSNITFTEPSWINSRCIDIDYYSIVNLINSTFANVNVGSIWGGALHLKKANTSIIDEQITIDSCVFINNNAGNGCSALLWATGIPTLINLSFKNQSTSKYVFCIFYEAFRDTSVVEDTVFENGVSANEDGGGSAIWIANNEDISRGRPFELTFRNCTWRNNEAKERGGALHYGNSKTLEGVQLTFERCHFIGNHAKKEGGAVSLVTKSPIVFSDCTFRDNYVEAPKTRAAVSTTGTKGGSISINSRTPLVSISGCSFTNETSDEGNAIFIHNKVQACLISGCIFKNCGKTGTVIISETLELMLLNSEITFDRRSTACRGLEIKIISVTTISQTKFRNCYSTGVGAGIYLNNTLESEEQEDFSLEGCVFDTCETAADGCALYLNVSSAPVIRGNTFQNHRFDKNISVILNHYDFQDLFSIQSCKFINNQFQNTQTQDGGGCAMFIANTVISQYESTYKLSFEDCTWSKNSAAYGGAFSYGTNTLVRDVELVFERCTFAGNTAANDRGGALHLSTTQPILFDECTFTNNRCHSPNSQNAKQGGAVYISKCASVSITSSTFNGNYGTNGHALFVEDIPSCSIFGCTFDSNNEARSGSQIATRCAELTLYDTTIKFDAKKVQARGVEILKQCSSSFSNCNFLNCNVTDMGGGIHIVEDMATNRTETLTLDNCLFDRCDSSNGCAIQGSISCNPTIRKCTFSNSNQGHFIITIFFNSVPRQTRFVTFDECTFEGNYFAGVGASSDAGGIGLWMAYKKELSSESLSLSFDGCNFISNLCGKNGGAFAYGESDTLKNISLTFEGCTFRENTCNGGAGGALYITTKQPLTITSCHFINNKCNGANTKGAAIYINSPSEIIQIRDSTFTGGQSIDGAGIYSSSQTTNLVISGSVFTNCGSSPTGSVIYSEAIVFDLQTTDIVFDAAATIKCRGVQLTRKATATFNKLKLINCQSSGNGGGILINFQQGNNAESLLFKDVTIENADAANGCAMHVRTNIAPTLEEIKVKGCTSGHYVITIFFNTYVSECKLKGCQFENNEFANNGYPPYPDGGGSGIWIANDGQRDDTKDKTLTFEGCVWKGNSVKSSSSLKYGGGFALVTSKTTQQTKLVFSSCRFIENSAPDRGGALYLCTSLPVTITGCLFDGNSAADGASIYTETTSDVNIEYSQIARNKAGTNGAAYIKSSQQLKLLNVTFAENTGPTATSLYLENEGTATIENCNFDFTRSANQYQIRLAGQSTSATVTFRMGCFVHSGDSNGNTHIYSTHKGQVSLPAGNCFDTSQNIAISNQGGTIDAASGIFDCQKCGDIYVPTVAPEATPSASQGLVTSIPTEEPSHAATTSSSSQSGSSSNKKKKNTKTIAMIAGITAAVVVVIVVIIILIWLFVCRKRAAKDNNSDNASEMNDEQITEITGIDPGAEDPIWAGTNQDNPLFNGGDEQDEDQMIHNDFEESWGDSVI